MTGILVLVLMSASSLGYGAVLLRLLGLRYAFTASEHAALAFGLGIGIVGWLAFFPGIAGYLGAPVLVGLCLLGLPGLLFLRRPAGAGQGVRLDAWGWWLSAAIAAVLILDVFEGAAPPTDADSLAYHFALPRQFLAAGVIELVPRAVDGAVPLLLQMTYMVALGTGGETAMTLWTMLTGWLAVLLVFVVARRFLPLNWSLAAALLFLTTPAVVYGAGSGQVEVRNALFVLAGALALTEALRTRDPRFAVLAGVFAGFFAGAKYPGLLFVFAGGLVMLWGTGWFRRATAYSVAAVIAGGQWYVWNWWNIGDPFFPLLFGIVPYRDDFSWNATQHAYFGETVRRAEIAVPQNLFWLFAYPVKQMFSAEPAFESLRAGTGPAAALLAPAAAAGLWMRRRTALRSPLAVFLFLAIVVYVLWFFLGTSQRVRFLVPVYPLVLVALLAGAERAVASLSAWRLPVAAGILAALGIQFGSALLFGANFAVHALSGENREAFLARNVPKYEAVSWLNAHLGSEDYLLTPWREHLYFLQMPYLFAQPANQAQILARQDARDLPTLWRQMRAQGITHAIHAPAPPNRLDDPGLQAMLASLAEHGCLGIDGRGDAVLFPSRTLNVFTDDAAARTLPFVVYRLSPDTCHLTVDATRF